MSKITDELAKYATSNEYLFHGSPVKTDFLVPSQAYNNFQPDGPPAVFATPFYEIAIFRALSLIAKQKIESKKYLSGFSLDNGRLSFRASQETLDTIKAGIIGFVYILNKKWFQQYNPMEYRALNVVKPIRVIEVKYQDLLSEISVSS